MQLIKEGNSVLYLWSKSINDEIEKQVNQIKAIKNVEVKVENVERLLMGICFKMLIFDLKLTFHSF